MISTTQPNPCAYLPARPLLVLRNRSDRRTPIRRARMATKTKQNKTHYFSRLSVEVGGDGNEANGGSRGERGIRGEAKRLQQGGSEGGSEGEGREAPKAAAIWRPWQYPPFRSFAPCCRPWALPSLGTWAIKRKLTY